MATSLNASLNVKLNAASLKSSTKQISHALGRITGQASEFQKSLDASTARVFAFGATTAVLNGVTQAFKKLVATTIEVEKRLVEINSIFQATESTFNRFRNSIFQVAKETGQAFSTVAEGAAELARQGLSAEETASRLKAALVLTRISGLGAEKSVKALTAAINGFASAGLNANQIVNKMVAVDTAFAVSAQDLADGFSRAGSTAEDAGVSFNELLALITAVEQRTARGGAVIGNAFKSIFTRLQRGTTIEKLQELGVAINATQTGVQKLKALSTAIEGISDPTIVSQIKELAGGVFQINVVSATLKDLSNETGIFAEAAKVAASATNEAFLKNEALNKTIASQMNALVVGLTSLAERIGTISFGPLLEGLVGIASKLSGFLDKALDPEKGNSLIKGFFKGIGMFLSGPMVILFTAAFVKITKLVAKFAIEGMKSLFAMGTQSEKIRQIEGGIVGLLGRDAALRKVITSATATQAQKEQAVIAAIQRENALLTQQAAIMRSLAVAAASRGVRGFGASGFTGKGGRRFAGGFRAEEAEARMLGAKNPKAHRSKGTIGGRRFTMNDGELEVPDFGTNGDSAVVPMTYARGFVPNYAGNVGDIERGSYSQYFDANGRAKSKWMRTAMANPKSKLGMALLAKKKQAASKRTYYANESPNKAVMLVPQIADYKMNAADHKFLAPYSTKINKKIDFFEGGAAGISKKLKTSKRFSSILKLDKIIEDNLAAGANNALNQVGSKAKFKLKPSSYKGKAFKNLMEKGGSGAFGAIKGALFEAIMKGITGGVAQGSGGTLDVDFKKDEDNILDEIFGIKGFSYGDFKASMGEKPKYARQILKNVRGKVGRSGTKPKVTNELGRAAGFIPNFARDGGVPASRIRIHRGDDGRGEMITNTRDEPRGVQDAIKREKKGVGMFAGGFIPNYHADFSMGAANRMSNFDPRRAERVGATGAAAPNVNLGKLQNAANKTASALGKTNEGLGKMQTSGMGVYMLFGVLQTGLGTIVAMNEKRIATAQTLADKEIDKIEASDKDYFTKQRLIKQQEDLIKTMQDQPPALVKLAKAATVAATALFALSSINMLTGGALGRSKAAKGVGGFFGGGGKGAGAGVKGPLGLHGGTIKEAAKATKRSRLGKSAVRGTGALAVGMGAFDIYNTLSNKDLSKHQKEKGVGGALGGMGGAIGGAIAGQALIPIPVVGAIIGGVIGGVLGGKAGEVIGGGITPEKKGHGMSQAYAQASFFAGGKGKGMQDKNLWQYERGGHGRRPSTGEMRMGMSMADYGVYGSAQGDKAGQKIELDGPQVLGTGKDRGMKGMKFNIGEDVLHKKYAEPILKKMGADIQANVGNVPFEALTKVEEQAAGDIQDWVDAKERYEKENLRWIKGGKRSDSGAKGARKIEDTHQKKLEMADRAILKYNDQLANALALKAGWNFKSHEDQVAWESRIGAARANLETATGQYAKATFDLAQAQSKRLTAAKQQVTEAKDQEFLVNALATGPNALAAKTMAGFNTQEASLDLLRENKGVARDALTDSYGKAMESTRDMRGKGGEERGLAIDQIIAPFEDAAKATSLAFKSGAFKFGVALLAKEKEISALKLATQHKIGELLSETVTSMVSHVKSIYERGGIDATMMEAQGNALSGMVNQASMGELDESGLRRLGQMISEYDEGGTGMDPQELSSFFGTTLEQWKQVMIDVRNAGVTGEGADTLMGRTTTVTNAAGEEVQQTFGEAMAKKKGYDNEALDELTKQEIALAGAMSVVTGKMEKFFGTEDTEDVATQIAEMEKAINKHQTTADGINDHLKKVLKASTSQAKFIEDQATFAKSAIATMSVLATKMEELEGKVKTITNQTDVNANVLPSGPTTGG